MSKARTPTIEPTRIDRFGATNSLPPELRVSDRVFQVAVFLVATLGILAATQQNARAADGYAILPIVFDSKYGFSLVSVEVAGAKIPVNFDLGGSNLQLALSPAILKKYGIHVQYTGNDVHGTDARGVRTTYKEFILSQIKLGRFVINDVKGIEYHAWGGAGAPKNGIVGYDLISKFNVIIDFPAAKIVLIDGGAAPPGYDIASWPRVPFNTKGRMITEAKIKDKTLSLLWDTGTPLSSVKLGDQIAGDVAACSTTVLFQLAETEATCRKITTADFVMGEHDFGHITLHTRQMPGLPADGMIGDDFFRQYIVFIDFRDRMVALHKAVP